jgi:hypothetical protein
VHTFLSAKFQLFEQRFVRRLNKLKDIERQFMREGVSLNP